MEALREILPSWAYVLVLLAVSIIVFGPKYLQQWLELGKDWNEKSDEDKRQYVALLMKNLQEKDERIKKLEAEVDDLRKPSSKDAGAAS